MILVSNFHLSTTFQVLPFDKQNHNQVKFLHGTLWRVSLSLLSVGITAPIASDYLISSIHRLEWDATFDDGQSDHDGFRLSLGLFLLEGDQRFPFQFGPD